MSFGDTTSTGMTSLTGNQNSARSVSAFFDSREHAEFGTARFDCGRHFGQRHHHNRGIP